MLQRLLKYHFSLEELLLAFIAGVSFLLIFIIPPFQKTDEVSHYYKTIAVATGNLVCQTDSNHQQYNLIPKSSYDLPLQMMADFVNQDVTHRFPRRALLLPFQTGFDNQKVQETASCSLPFIFYAPVSLLLALPIWLKLNTLITFYLGRFFFFLLALGLFYWSKRVLQPRFHLLLLGCLSLPMVLIQISSFNKEVFHIGFGALAFALFMSLRERYDWKKMLGLVVSLLFVILPRPPFFPFLILIPLAVPRMYWRKVNATVLIGLLSAVLIFGAASTYFFYPKLVSFSAPIVTLDGISPPLQYLYLQKYPLRFVEVVFSSYTNHMEAYYKSLVGTYGYIHTYLDWYIYAFYGVFIAWLVYTYAKQKDVFNWIEITLLSGMLFISTIAMFFLMYVYATPVGFHYVVDVQGRYFLVMLPYIILIAAHHLRHLRQRTLLVGLAFIIIMLLKNAYNRYYDYSLGYYHSELPPKAVRVIINQKVTQHISIDPGKKFRGLAFYVDNWQKFIDQPMLITIYDDSCSQQLGEALLMAHINKTPSYLEAAMRKKLTGYSSLCYTLDTFGPRMNNTPHIFMKGDPTTRQPIALPLYEY